MKPTPSGIRFIENNDIGESLVNSLASLTNFKLNEENIRINQNQKLEDALTVVTSGMAARDASEINDAMQNFISETKNIARQYNGNIPFDKWAEIRSKKANIEAMVKKSASDQQEFNNITKYINTTGHSYIDIEGTSKSLQDAMNKGLMDRGDLWSSVVPNVDILKILKDNINKYQSGGYEIKGNKVVTTKSNSPELQIKGLMSTRDDFRRAVEAKWQENPSGYATPEEYAVGMYKPFVENSSSNVKQWGSRSVGSSSKATKQYTVDSNGVYNFSTSPIILHDITDNAGRSLGTYSISRIREADNGKVYGIGTATNFYYNFTDLVKADKAVKGGSTSQEMIAMADLYDKIPGEDEAEKKSKYTNNFLDFHPEFENANKKAGESVEIELSDSDAALVKEKLASWKRVEMSSKPASKPNKPVDDPKGYF